MDTSLSGRLLSLVDKIRSLRKKKEEEEPEADEDSKPGEINNQFICELDLSSMLIQYYRYKYSLSSIKY